MQNIQYMKQVKVVLCWQSIFYTFGIIILIYVGSNQISEAVLLKPVKLKLECQVPANFVFKQSLETTALKPHIVSIISPKPHFHISSKLPFCYKNKAWAITRPTKICTVTTLTNFFFFYFNWSYLLYNIVVIFAIHWYASATGVHVPHPEPPSHLSPCPIPQVIPVHWSWTPCLMHWTWTGDLFHIR